MSQAIDRRPSSGPQPLDHLIRESLRDDGRLWVAGEIAEGQGAYHAQLYTFYLAPYQPLFDVPRLNTLLKSILPGLKRHETHDFYQPTPDSDMSIGIIHYQEQVGTKITRTTEIILPNQPFSLNGTGLQESEFTEEDEENLYKVTSLLVYPHPLAAQVAFQKADLYQATDEPILVDTDLIGIQTHLTAALIAKLKEYDKQPNTEFLLP